MELDPTDVIVPSQATDERHSKAITRPWISNSTAKRGWSE